MAGETAMVSFVYVFSKIQCGCGDSRGAARLPAGWLDQFCMRNFTNSADFDDTLPVAEGRVEASFRVTPERFAEGLGAWLTQRGKGEGQPVQVQVTQV